MACKVNKPNNNSAILLMFSIDFLLASTISPMNIGKTREAKLDSKRKINPSKYADL